ncbi:hypothetical protein NG831_19605 [Xanthomonas sacchari]|uniref:hypothetical protein n=1 Tax=Xanthomonas sacchari TaxID=56458 RepID=UPI002255AAB7|nr:hypothetical protein [Xanthomonas sacchari]UYK66299.1 hypothetical protein NG831_19605 [Xanthomonas sacchari]
MRNTFARGNAGTPLRCASACIVRSFAMRALVHLVAFARATAHNPQAAPHRVTHDAPTLHRVSSATRAPMWTEDAVALALRRRSHLLALDDGDIEMVICAG